MQYAANHNFLISNPSCIAIPALFWIMVLATGCSVQATIEPPDLPDARIVQLPLTAMLIPIENAVHESQYTYDFGNWPNPEAESINSYSIDLTDAINSSFEDACRELFETVVIARDIDSIRDMPTPDIVIELDSRSLKVVLKGQGPVMNEAIAESTISIRITEPNGRLLYILDSETEGRAAISPLFISEEPSTRAAVQDALRNHVAYFLREVSKLKKLQHYRPIVDASKAGRPEPLDAQRQKRASDRKKTDVPMVALGHRMDAEVKEV